jgi:outer membrane protein OmpA-like peptidoglycan-associated protein
MLNNSKAFITFFIWVILALSFHHYISNSILNFCFENSTSSKQTITSQKQILAITHNENDTIFSFQNSFNIIKNTDSIYYTKNEGNLVDSIKTYLQTHYDKKLLITGLFSSVEKPKNLGLKRATLLKNQLQNSHIDSKRIEIDQLEETTLFTKKNSVTNGLALKFINRKKEVIDSIEQAITHKILHINFTENNKIIDSILLLNYLPYLKRYCKKYPNKSIEITGHTDNIGYFQNNLIKGLNWANETREFLLKKGFNSIQITTNSKGESKPIATKYTEEGKAKNRRIEIKIK